MWNSKELLPGGQLDSIPSLPYVHRCQLSGLWLLMERPLAYRDMVSTAAVPQYPIERALSGGDRGEHMGCAMQQDYWYTATTRQ